MSLNRIQILPRKKTTLSAVQLGRLDYAPPLPLALREPSSIVVKDVEATQCLVEDDADIIKRLAFEDHSVATLVLVAPACMAVQFIHVHLPPLFSSCFPSTYGANLVEMQAGKGTVLKDKKTIGIAFCGRQVSALVFCKHAQLTTVN